VYFSEPHLTRVGKDSSESSTPYSRSYRRLRRIHDAGVEGTILSSGNFFPALATEQHLQRHTVGSLDKNGYAGPQRALWAPNASPLAC
jgi:hypothetical protein